MPTAALRPCSYPGCPALVPQGACLLHRGAVDRARGQRGGPRTQGYTSRWDRYSRAFRTRYPVCGDRPPGYSWTGDSVCVPRTLADVVDHIRRVTSATDPGFYDVANHQALCHACHNRKRQHESRGIPVSPALINGINANK